MVDAGMNSALVLVILLLAVPLQLFLSHYINTIYTTSNAKSVGSESIESARIEAFNRYSSGDGCVLFCKCEAK